MAKKTRILTERLISSLEAMYSTLWWSSDFFPGDSQKDPFKRLVLTILSQNTSDINSIRAYKKLATVFNITPEVLARADEKTIRKAIKTGGLYRIKAKRLKTVSREVIEKFSSDVGSILALPKNEAKRRLMELSGVGNKTADVVLTDKHTYRKIIPVDTHMNRIAKRIGLVSQSAQYEETQQALLRFVPAKRRERAFGLLWLMAKYTCRARNPKCYECVLRRICAYKHKNV